jgi:hypothetical protein
MFPHCWMNHGCPKLKSFFSHTKGLLYGDFPTMKRRNFRESVHVEEKGSKVSGQLKSVKIAR